MIEQELEEKILSIVREADTCGFQIYGLWEICKTGFVKALDNASIAVCIVKVPPKKFETFGFSKATFSPVVTLAVRVDSDTSGQKALEFSDRLQSRFDKLNLETSLDGLSPLKTEHFTPGGFHLLEGQGPDYDSQASTWTYVWQFEVEGTIERQI